MSTQNWFTYTHVIFGKRKSGYNWMDWIMWRDWIELKRKKVEEIMNSITINMSKLDENSKKCEHAINYNLDNIIKTVNKRRGQLLSNLKTTKDNKHNQFCYEKSQLMIHDLNIDKQQRKTKILNTTNDLLKNKMMDDFVMNSNINMNFKIDMNKINNAILCVGEIQSEEKPLAPIVYVKSTKGTSAIIAIASSAKLLVKSIRIEYKLEYVECDNDDIKSNDDMKLQWTSVTIKCNENVRYVIKSLKALTNYMIRSAVRNQNGWSEYCAKISFKTRNLKRIEVNDKLEPQNIAICHTLNCNVITHNGYKNDSTSVFTNIITKGRHHWQFKLNRHMLKVNGLYWEYANQTGKKKRIHSRSFKLSNHVSQTGTNSLVFCVHSCILALLNF